MSPPSSSLVPPSEVDWTNGTFRTFEIGIDGRTIASELIRKFEHINFIKKKWKVVQ